MSGKIKIGTVGLGLMGSSIATCLLASGHAVTSLIRDIDKADEARARIHNFLEQLKEEGRLQEDPSVVMQRFVITNKAADLAGHELVLESITENVEVKKELFRELEEVLSPSAIIGSNTSAIPVTILQSGLKHPERILGVHWGEPAHVLRFLEVICGERSDIANAERVVQLAESWGKEPSLVRKDIRGFITNRLMYAMYREAFYLVENGYATVEDIDRACRNNAGYWMTLLGVFGWMDMTGVAAYHNVMKELFPTLSNSQEVPKLIDDIVKAGGRGVANGKGFYEYTPEEAKMWEDTFTEFSFDIKKLADKYNSKLGR